MPIRISTGKISATEATERISLMPSGLVPTRQAPHSPCMAPVPMIAVTRWAPGMLASSSGWRPTTMISESGPGSATGPMVPTCRPG